MKEDYSVLQFARPIFDRRIQIVRPNENARDGLAGVERSGADRARTDDLLHAMQALSQLSYSPNLQAGCLEQPGTSKRSGLHLPVKEGAFPAERPRRGRWLRPPLQ